MLCLQDEKQPRAGIRLMSKLSMSTPLWRKREVPHRFVAGFIQLALLVVSVSVAHSVQSRDAAAFPPRPTLEEVRERIDGASKSHPRLLATKGDFEAVRAAIAGDPLKQRIAENVIARATALQETPPVERVIIGRRLLQTSRTCLERVLTLAMAYHLSGDREHAKRCQQEMLAAARFRDWNPDHFLDVAEMTFALALGYDWLHDDLDEAARNEIRQAIVVKGIGLQFAHRDNWWVTVANNWGQVCHAGMTAGALAVLENEPDLAARTLHSAINNVVPAMRQYAPEGGYPEGPQYWSYGTTFNVLLIACLESAVGSDFGLSAAPGFDKTGRFLAVVSGPTGLLFNYSDGGARRDPEPVLAWFAARFNHPEWLAGERQRWQARLDERREDGCAPTRFMPLLLLWLNDRETPTAAGLPLHWSSGGETPITIHRSGWGADATFVGLKAGSPSASHGQMDGGSFVLDSDGVRWGVDLEPEDYHAIESQGMDLWSRGQDSDRWRILRLNNYGHNTLVIDGGPQSSSGTASIVAFSDDREWPHSIVDLGDMYRDHVKTARRGVVLLPSRQVIIRDELSGLKPGTRVRWAMITRGEPSGVGSDRLVLSEGNKNLTLIAEAEPAATWQVIDISTPKNDFDSANPGARIATLEAEAPPTGMLTITVLATPGSCSNPHRITSSAIPLSSWPPNSLTEHPGTP
jgi:hypothetical protein